MCGRGCCDERCGAGAIRSDEQHRSHFRISRQHDAHRFSLKINRHEHESAAKSCAPFIFSPHPQPSAAAVFHWTEPASRRGSKNQAPGGGKPEADSERPLEWRDYGQHEEVDVGSSIGSRNSGMSAAPAQAARIGVYVGAPRLQFRLALDRVMPGSVAIGPTATGCRAIGTSSASAAPYSAAASLWSRAGLLSWMASTRLYRGFRR